MSLTTILVHLADDADHGARLQAAYGLARRHGAHVAALYVTTPVGMPEAIEGRGASRGYLEQATARSRDKARTIEREFGAWRQAHGMTGEWRTEEGRPLDILARHSLYADLAIVSQSDPASLEEMLTDALPDHLAMVGACATLVLPRGFVCGDAAPGRRVLVAWKPGRECARAVRDALPLLQAAEAVTVTQVTRGAEDAASGGRLVDWLGRHGVRAAPRQAERHGSVAETLYGEAAAACCDLLVMGAYGRSRLRELVLGGVTRDVLSGAPLPLLMSH